VLYAGLGRNQPLFAYITGIEFGKGGQSCDFCMFAHPFAMYFERGFGSAKAASHC
jgi:hypothetical protein